MREQGIVVSLDGDFAEIKVNKKSECSKCGACLFPKNQDYVIMRAHNGLKAKAGDKVIIDSSTGTSLLGVFLAFIVPLLLIGVTMLLNYLWIRKEIYILIISVILIVLWYTILAVLEKRFKVIKKLTPIIISIENKGENV